MGRIHYQSISLEELIDKSDCVFLGKRLQNIPCIQQMRFADSTRSKTSEYSFQLHSFEVMEFLKGTSPSSSPILQLCCDSALLKLMPISYLYNIQGTHKSPIIEQYQPIGNVNLSQPTLCFVSWKSIQPLPVNETNHVAKFQHIYLLPPIVEMHGIVEGVEEATAELLQKVKQCISKESESTHAQLQSTQLQPIYFPTW